MSDTIIKDITGLQKNYDHLSDIVERLDTNISKLTEVSSAVSQLLAVHGSRLDFQERVNEQFQKQIETIKSSVSGDLRVLHKRVDTVHKETKDEVQEYNDDILNEIKLLRQATQDQHNKLEDRLTRIEKLSLMVIGGATVLWTVFNLIFPSLNLTFGVG